MKTQVKQIDLNADKRVVEKHLTIKRKAFEAEELIGAEIYVEEVHGNTIYLSVKTKDKRRKTSKYELLNFVYELFNGETTNQYRLSIKL